MISRRTAAALAAALSALCAAPLAAQSGCSTHVLPEDGPALSVEKLAAMPDTSVDTELVAAVRTAAREAGIDDPRGYMVVERDARGRWQIHLHRSNVPERLVRQVQRTMADRLTAAAEPDGRVFVNRRIDPVDLPAQLPAGPEIEECAPRMAGAFRLEDRLLALLERSAPEGNPAIWTSLRLWVTSDGEVAYARVQPSTSLSHLDRALARDFARQLRFTPASVNGIPVSVWAELPLSLPARAPRDRSREMMPPHRGAP